MHVRFYANFSDAEESAIDSTYEPAMKEVMDQLSNNVGPWYIHEYSERPCVAGSDKYEMKDNFNDYIDNSSDDLWQKYGAHVLVTDDCDSGVADGGNDPDHNAYVNDLAAIVPLDTSDYGINICIQEALHPFISYDYDEVNSMCEGNEHHLGTDFSSNNRSPMCTSYDGADGKGSCESWAWQHGHTTTLTDCTEKALHECWTYHK
jgi:hypothetical protein